MTRTSMRSSAIAPRTSAQRRSSSAVDIGWLMRSLVAMYLPLHDVAHAVDVAGEKFPEIIHHGRQRLFRVLVVEAAEVGRHDDVVHGPERVALGKGLGREYVERGACEPFFAQGGDERVLVDDPPAREIHEK